MAMLQKVLDAVRDSFREVGDRRAAIDAEIARLTRERVELLAPPLPLDDFIAMQMEMIDHQAEAGAQLFGRRFMLNDPANPWASYMKPLAAESITDTSAATLWRTDQRAIRLLDPFERASDFSGTRAVAQDALCALLGEALKDGLARLLRAQLLPKWPAKVGLPRAERIARAERITARLVTLRAEAAELDQVVRDAAAEISRTTGTA